MACTHKSQPSKQHQLEFARDGLPLFLFNCNPPLRIEKIMKPQPSKISEEIYIISSFNEQQESQISNFTSNIDEHIKSSEIERWFQYSPNAGEVGTDQIEHLAGINSDEHDVREMFTQVMPIYQRQAMLLTLWGAFECELERAYKITSKIIRGTDEIPKNKKGLPKIGHLTNQFSKIGIPEKPSDTFKDSLRTLIDEVRLIRNLWAHNGGRDEKGKLPKNIQGVTLQYAQIALSKEYIEKVIDLMRNVSVELDAGIFKAARSEKHQGCKAS